MKAAVAGALDKARELETKFNQPQKMCSAGRDTIIVPLGWSPEQGNGLGTSVGARVWQVGCVTGGQYSWRELNGGGFRLQAPANGSYCKLSAL